MEGVPGYPDCEGHHELVHVREVPEVPAMRQVRKLKKISFVPKSAINFVPQSALLLCDNRCSEKTHCFWQCASVVVDDGEEAHTINLCQQCYNESLVARGDKPLTKWQWYTFVEKTEQNIREMWEYCCHERDRVKEVPRGS